MEGECRVERGPPPADGNCADESSDFVSIKPIAAYDKCEPTTDLDTEKKGKDGKFKGGGSWSIRQPALSLEHDFDVCVLSPVELPTAPPTAAVQLDQAGAPRGRLGGPPVDTKCELEGRGKVCLDKHQGCEQECLDKMDTEAWQNGNWSYIEQARPAVLRRDAGRTLCREGARRGERAQSLEPAPT